MSHLNSRSCKNSPITLRMFRQREIRVKPHILVRLVYRLGWLEWTKISTSGVYLIGYLFIKNNQFDFVWAEHMLRLDIHTIEAIFLSTRHQMNNTCIEITANTLMITFPWIWRSAVQHKKQWFEVSTLWDSKLWDRVDPNCGDW